MRFDSLRRLAPLCLLLVVAACGEKAPPVPAEDRLVLQPARFADLPGWQADATAELLPALQRSCQRFAKLPATAPVGPEGLAGTAADWQAACAGLPAGADDATARAWLEAAFRPFLATNNGKADGLFTGYYEPEVRGALAPDATHRWPLYTPPPDLVTVKLGRFRGELEGETLVGRLAGREVLPYWTREEIDAEHKLVGQGLELVWLSDYLDLFFLQVQGSGRVVLPDGSIRRVGYAANNGHPFYAIGKALIESGQIAKDQVSMQAIRDWLEAHPEEAWGVMRQNARYIFFRWLEGEGPLGAEGVALTPGRSLAVDTRFLPLGVPLFLATTWPAGERPLQRLMVAQDTGGAIKGPVRGDFFWGAGEAALAEAGRMKQQGRYWLLLPLPVAERLAASE